MSVGPLRASVSLEISASVTRTGPVPERPDAAGILTAGPRLGVSGGVPLITLSECGAVSMQPLWTRQN